MFSILAKILLITFLAIFSAALGSFSGIYIAQNYESSLDKVFPSKSVSPTPALETQEYLKSFLEALENPPPGTPELRGLVFGYEDNISEIPQEAFNHPTLPQSLKQIIITGGQISNLPAEIGSFENLEVLEIRDNNLATLPAEIGNLTSLTQLKLGGNAISFLPSEIGNLEGLTLLYLYDNNLSSLPEEIGNLTNLTVLDLHNNNLTALPESISNLQNLKLLYLGGNNLSEQEKERIKSLLPNTQIHF